MKTRGFSNGFILLVLALVCTTCTKDDAFFSPDGEESLLKAAKIKVMPSMAPDDLIKAEEDWQNINDALQNAGPGETVQLAEGLFYLNKSIVVWDFNGTLKGSGMNGTTIQTTPGELFDVSSCPPLILSFKENDGFFMFCFAHQYNDEIRTVAVTDMTIIVNEPTTPYYQFRNTETPEEGNTIQAIHVQYENLDNDLANPINLNVTYKNITVIGEKDEKYLNTGYSLYAGLAAFGASSGIFEAKNITIENANIGILPYVFNGENSTVNVKNCSISNTRQGINSIFTSSWTILNSEFANCWVSIFLNKYNNGPIVELPTGNSYIKNNKINVNGGVAMAVYNLNNTEVNNNVFYGSGFTGLYTEGGDGWSIVNNDFCDITNPVLGATLFLINPMNFEVRNNLNQTVGGPFPFDPSNYIGDGRECVNN